MKINEETIRKAFPLIEPYISGFNPTLSYHSWCVISRKIGEHLGCSDVPLFFYDLENDARFSHLTLKQKALNARLFMIANIVTHISVFQDIEKYLKQEQIWNGVNYERYGYNIRAAMTRGIVHASGVYKVITHFSEYRTSSDEYSIVQNKAYDERARLIFKMFDRAYRSNPFEILEITEILLGDIEKHKKMFVTYRKHESRDSTIVS